MVRISKCRAEQKDTPGEETAGAKTGRRKQSACGRDEVVAVVGLEKHKG